MKPRIAIVCDWLVSRGGAERVIASMAGMFPDAPIFTSVYDAERLPEYRSRSVVTSFLQKIWLSKHKHHLFLPFMPLVFESFNFSDFDIVISSAHSCAKGIITKPETLHVSYCHSPMRYAWENCHEYFERFGIPEPLKFPAKKLLHELRMWDRLAAERVDVFVANSEHVRQRIRKYYRKDSTVIYPPVETDVFGSGEKQEGRYYLAVGRLAAYKRFDLIVKVFNELSLPLIIAGTGKEERALKKMAGRFVTFTGQISDPELAELYRGAIALIFPQQEDFGIIPLEAMSAGAPVIAYGSGGALETVLPQETGVFFMEQRAESLQKAVLESRKILWNTEKIRQHAKAFRRTVFEEKFKKFLKKEWDIWREMIIDKNG